MCLQVINLLAEGDGLSSVVYDSFPLASTSAVTRTDTI